MYKVVWDKRLNGILLKDSGDYLENITPPRPVFFEELNLLGFNNFWDYPKSQDPLLWAIKRKYYYKGELVAEMKGGTIFDSPEIVIAEKGQNLKLEPIDINKVIKKNKEALFVLENEALDFIEHTYNVYKKKNFLFVVSYSGGKDSQVVLDLLTRSVPPDDLIIIFSDTTMETSYTYENVRKTKEEYEKRYAGLRFYTAKPPKPAIEFWKEFGPPSVKQRWCHTVTKMAPIHKVLKNIVNEENWNYDFPKILVFEGVRSDESIKRSKYERIRQNTKHFYQINAEVIQNWNITEVYLYLFMRNLIFNKGYRYGLDRIGCVLCPYGSPRNEHILYKIDKDIMNKFINVVYEYGDSLGLSKEDSTEFIADGQWKKRAGGRGLNNNGTALLLSFETNSIEAVSRRPRENILEWLKTVGDLHYKKKDNDNVIGQIRIRNETLPFTIFKDKENEKIWINTGTNPVTKELLKKVLYKSTYCMHCRACAEECPTEAINMVNLSVKINTDLCTHCGNCLNFAEKGCLAAKSLVIYGDERPMKRDRIATSKFQNFGLRRDWLVFFLHNLNDWFSKTNLGNRQIESLKTWLQECDLLDKNMPTNISKLLGKIVDNNELLIWEIVWANLYYNVSLIRWYLEYFEWNSSISGKDIVAKLLECDINAKEKTAKNAVSSLLNLFDSTPIGSDLKIGLIEKKDRQRYIKKIGTDDIHPLSVAYSLYKAAEYLERKDFTISELYNKDFKGGPFMLFGISRDKLERILRGLQEDKEQILRVDLVADLENIHLRDDLSSVDVVKIAEARFK